jgi:hypothetical protein
MEVEGREDFMASTAFVDEDKEEAVSRLALRLTESSTVPT